jgi:hypothetical protein
MHVIYDEDEYETVSETRPCSTCKGDPRECHGVGCDGSSSIGSRRRSPEEVKAIKEAKRKHEDAVLAAAEAIKIRRLL